MNFFGSQSWHFKLCIQLKVGALQLAAKCDVTNLAQLYFGVTGAVSNTC